MKKVSIISPIFDNVNRVGQTINDLTEFFRGKYNFEVLYYHTADIAEELKLNPHFMFYRIEKGQSFDDCVTDGFSKANGHCIIVADLDNTNYKDYILKLLVEWENNAQVVLIKQEEEKLNFFKRIGRFFGRLFQRAYDLLLGTVGLSKDFRASRAFQLFSENVVEVIKEFPEKNYYLRNFDCWIDYRVTVLYVKSLPKVNRHEKVANLNFILSLVSSALFLTLLLVTIFTSHLIVEASRPMYVLIGIALMVTFLAYSLYCLFKWFIYRKTRLTSTVRK